MSDRLRNKDVYVDLDVELINYLKDTYLDKMKRLMNGLNQQLANIASYSIGIQATDPQVSDFYVNKLKQAIDVYSQQLDSRNKVARVS